MNLTERLAALLDLPLEAVYIWRSQRSDQQNAGGYICMTCGKVMPLASLKRDDHEPWCGTSSSNMSSSSYTFTFTHVVTTP